MGKEKKESLMNSAIFNYAQMETFFNAFPAIDTYNLQSLAKLGAIKNFNKGEWILNEGKSVKHIFFILEGLVRGFRYVRGIDTTHHFFIQGKFCTDYESFLTGKKGELILEAITDLEVITFQKESWNNYFTTYTEMERVRSLIAEEAYLTMVERTKEFQIKDLKDRYLSLINKNIDLFQQVPQIHIASYLGVAPQSLSRIKADHKRG